MSGPLALQWSLDRTAEGAYIIAKEIIRAASTYRGDVLAMASCQSFGASLAMSEDAQAKIRNQVLRVHPHWTVEVLKSIIGFNNWDVAMAMGSGPAGEKFLGLACALSTIQPLQQRADSLKKMLDSAKADGAKADDLAPSAQHLGDLLSALQPRLSMCARDGFGEMIVNYQVAMENGLRDPAYGSSSRELKKAPSPEFIKDLVNAFREIGRVGNANYYGIEVSVYECSAWVAAFTEWCLEAPLILVESPNKQLKLFQGEKMSRVSIVIKMRQDFQSSPAGIKLLRRAEGPHSLLYPDGANGQDWEGRVGVKAYGKWLLHELGFDQQREYRLLTQVLPHALRFTLDSLTFSKAWSATWDRHEESVNTNAALGELTAQPFPALRTIQDAYGLLLGISSPPPIETIDRICVADVPIVSEYIREMKMSCRCDQCKLSRGQTDPLPGVRCAKDTFFYGLAKITADILTLSLFLFPENLVVETFRHRYTQKHETFVKDILPILELGIGAEGDVRSILTSARALIGHGHLDKTVPDADWILTCDKGQAIYPAVFDGSYCIKREGYLTLIWRQGSLHDAKERWSGDTWNGVIGTETSWGQDHLLNVPPNQAVSPQNLFPQLSLDWEVVKVHDKRIMEAKIVAKDAGGKLMTTRNPIDSLLGLQYGLIVEACSHKPTEELAGPGHLCVYTSPESVHGHRAPHQTLIVPVDGADDLRFFCIPGAEDERNFVLRKDACLGCSLQVCRRSMIGLLIL